MKNNKEEKEGSRKNGIRHWMKLRMSENKKEWMTNGLTKAHEINAMPILERGERKVYTII